MKAIILRCSVADEDVASILQHVKELLPTWEASVQDVELIKLTLIDQKIIGEQCKFCALWSSIEGCRYDSGCSHPVANCQLLLANRR